MSLFDYKHYTTIMYLAITMTCILILFSFLNLAENINEKPNLKSQKNKLTGFAIEDQTENQISEISTQELYSLKIKTLFYSIFVGILILMINLIIILILLKKDKKIIEEIK